MYFGYDLLSFYIIILRIFICRLIIISRGKIYFFNNYYLFFNFILFVLLVSLILAFSSINIFLFYLFFELRLIPTLFLILGWGYQPERLQAGYYIFFYTLIASLPLLVSFFYIKDNFFTINFIFILENIFFDYYFILFVLLVFLVKIPIFGLHLWLPKAHVEAPVSGSIILAGVILKLGGYGMIRLISMFSLFFSFFRIFIRISLMGGVIVSLICFRQSDIKSLVAYSSVAHMGFVIGGLFTLNIWGLSGSILIIVAHGLCSSGLFCLVNLNYERLLSRRFYVNKGMINLIPNLTF